MMIRTSPFFLENLLWLCLDFAMNAAGPGKTINLLVEKSVEAVRVKFAPLDRISDMSGREFPENSMKALLAVLQAELNIDEGNRELSLLIGAVAIEQ